MDGHPDRQSPGAEPKAAVPAAAVPKAAAAPAPAAEALRNGPDLGGAIEIMVSETGGALAGVGLTHAQFVLLLAVSEFEPVEPDLLGRIMAVGERRGQGELQPLVEKGAVCVNVDDAGATIVATTAHGRNLLQRAIPLWEAAQDRIQDRLGVTRDLPNLGAESKKPLAIG